MCQRGKYKKNEVKKVSGDFKGHVDGTWRACGEERRTYDEKSYNRNIEGRSWRLTLKDRLDKNTDNSVLSSSAAYLFAREGGREGRYN